jgi:hypothetical protein
LTALFAWRSGGYGVQDPNLLANGLLGGSLAGQLGAAGLAELGLTQGLAAMPQAPQSLPTNLGGLPGMPGGQGVDMLTAVSTPCLTWPHPALSGWLV